MEKKVMMHSVGVNIGIEMVFDTESRAWGVP